MSIWGNSKNKNELVLVFDIGSASVGGALFWAQENEVPKIIYSYRESMPLAKNITMDSFLSNTTKTLENVSKNISLAGLGVPNKIFCVLSSPWYLSQTRHILLKKNTPFVFNSKLADDLIQKEIALFEEEQIKKYGDSGIKMIPIELKNMKIALNGYNAPEPLNQKATDLEMAVFISIAQENTLKSFRESIGRYFYSNNVKFTSFTMASFLVARDFFIGQENFLLMDIGGEITDISMIKKDILVSAISFPLGTNFFIRKISSILDCTLSEAVAYLSLYKEGHMSDSSLVKIEPVISNLKKEWLKNFQESLANISNDISIPAMIFLGVDKELARFFTEIIKAEEFNQYTLAESKFKVIYLGNQALHGIVLFNENVERDPFLIIEALFINRFLIKNK